MPKPKVALGSSIAPAARARLEEFAEPIPFDGIAEADALYCDGELPVDATLLDRAPKLRVIASKSVGYDLADLDELTRRGIPYSNARGTLTETVADLVFALVVMSMRQVLIAIDWVRSGKWLEDQPPLAVDPAGKTLGIVGMGAIGLAVARRARVCGMRLAYYNRRRNPEDAEVEAAYLPFDDLLRTADCIAVCVPLYPQTRKLFGAREFALMKPGAFFVNGARGAVVDTQALYDALAAGRLAGAALDVTDPEPLPPDHPLLRLPNVIVTPHIASGTVETRERMALLAVENLRAGLAGKPLPTCVNEAANFRPR